MKVGDRIKVSCGPVVYNDEGRARRIQWGTVVEVYSTFVAVKHEGYPHTRDYGNSEIRQVALSR